MSINWLLPTVLSTTAGAVDVIGFLRSADCLLRTSPEPRGAGGALCYGGFNQAGPLLSVPVFVAVLGAVTLAVGTPRDFVRRGAHCSSCSWRSSEVSLDWELRGPSQTPAAL